MRARKSDDFFFFRLIKAKTSERRVREVSFSTSPSLCQLSLFALLAKCFLFSLASFLSFLQVRKARKGTTRERRARMLPRERKWRASKKGQLLRLFLVLDWVSSLAGRSFSRQAGALRTSHLLFSLDLTLTDAITLSFSHSIQLEVQTGRGATGL